MPWFQPGPLLLPEMLALNARWLAAEPALIVDDTTLTWAEFVDRCARFGGALHGMNLDPGTRVGVVMDNSLETAIALFGTVYAGLVAVPINVSVSDAAVKTMLANSAARAVVCNGSHIDRVDAVRADLPALAERCIAVDGKPGWHDFSALVAAASPVAAANAAPTDECNIIYSSGTTGLPKGIVHDHRCRAAWAYDMAVALRYRPGARTLCSLGLYSNISWVAMLSTFLAGGTLTVMPKFDVGRLLDIVATQKITHATMVPVQLTRILEDHRFDAANVASLESLMCCGSPLAPSVKEAVIAAFGPAFLELYGLTEGLVTVLQPEDMADKLRSVGKPCPGQELVILGADDHPCPPGESGEIVGRGPLLMAGYHERDDANEEATWLGPDGQRWLRTGDIGQLDDDGFLYLVDRKKDMIISGGQNIYPADIEAVVIDHPAVVDVAVIGVASERWGETPLAVVVADHDIDAVELVTWANTRLGRQQRIAGVEFISALPRNPNGKILKRELREQFRHMSL
ncbi:MAG: AMP-binding protein [Pseudomonadota bacterium]